MQSGLLPSRGFQAEWLEMGKEQMLAPRSTALPGLCANRGGGKGLRLANPPKHRVTFHLNFDPCGSCLLRPSILAFMGLRARSNSIGRP